MSEWCANCHEGILRNAHAGGGTFEHPSGSTETFSSETIAMYNAYINTGALLSPGAGAANVASAYLQFVPFERGIGNPQLLDPTSTAGPNATSRIMCLSCHRAHSSAFAAIGRWDFGATLLAESHPAPGDGGQSGNDVNNSYYGRNIAVEFGTDQGPFCEKCHGLSLAELPESGLAQPLQPLSDPLLETGLGRPPGADPLLQNPFQP
ncbi:MAG: hypothetical protein IH612_13185 [Desulfofustis sp.]|nr:hypothetical protein [Desulfofustis sp.]